jgi:hypothetical protein
MNKQISYGPTDLLSIIIIIIIIIFLKLIA